MTENEMKERGIVPQRKLAKLLDEANQLTAIIVASRKTSVKGHG